MNCKNCGAKVAKTAKFCPKCGEKIVIDEETAKVEEKIDEALNTKVSDDVKVQTASEKKKNNLNPLALAGFITSIVSLCCCCGSLSGIALILSIIGLVQINSGNKEGKGFAIAGIAVAAVGVVFLIIMSALGEFGEIYSQALNHYMIFLNR